jgi:hypothetical protein
VTALAFPDTDDLPTLCNWYAENMGEIQALGKELRRVERRLTEYVHDVGAVRTTNGLLSIEGDGFDWSIDDVALALPALVSVQGVRITGPQSDIEELVSTLLTMPTLQYTLERTIDKVTAARVIRDGGPVGEALEAARSPRGRLGLR